MSFWNSHQFKKLNRKWREKLAKSGFKDLEKPSGAPLRDALVWDDLKARASFKPEIVEEVAQYYRWAEDMANHGRFKSTIDKKIWTLHAKGETSREIADHLPVKLDQSTICAHIRKTRDYLRLQIRKKSA